MNASLATAGSLLANWTTTATATSAAAAAVAAAATLQLLAAHSLEEPEAAFSAAGIRPEDLFGGGNLTTAGLSTTTTTVAPFYLLPQQQIRPHPSSNCSSLYNRSCNNSGDPWADGGGPLDLLVKPSKYAAWEVVIIAVLTAITAIVTVLGNILVLIAFAVERTLRQPSNYFIASLAVTDLLIGLFSMPAYSTYLLLERWPMPDILCDIWLALDYTVCLVSQYNVLLITVDRFCSVKIPAKYRNWRAKRKVQIMVIATWIVPSSIFFPIHLGWDTFVGKRGMSQGSCDAQYIKSNPTFNVVLIFSYFWSTMVVLLILYAGIYQTAFSLQRKSQAKHHKVCTSICLTFFHGTLRRIGK